MRRRTRRIAGLISALFLIPLALVAGLLLFIQTGPGRAAIVWAIETFGSNEDMVISIGALNGRIPFDMTLSDVALADREGVWLDIDRARLAWRPFALAAGTLSIGAVDVGDISVARLPVAPATEPAESGGGGIPTLPFKVDLDRLNVDRLALGEPVLGVPAAIAIDGDARIGRPSDGLAMRLDINRIDGTPGTVAVRLGYRPDDEYLDFEINVDEPAGGLVSRLSGMPGLPPLRVAVAGADPVDDFSASIGLKAGDQARASGTVTVRRQALDGGGAGRALSADIEGDLAGLLQPAYAPLAEGRTKLTARVLFPDSGPISIESFEVLAAAGWVSLSGLVDPQSRAASIDYELVAGESHRFAGAIPVEASWRGIELSGSADYRPDRAAVSADLMGEDLAVQGNAIGSLDIALTADAAGPVDDPDTEIAVTADVQATGLVPADSTLSGAAGEELRLTLAGTATPAGRFEADPLNLVLGAGEIEWTGVVAPTGFDGVLKASKVDLSNFAALSGLDLRGIAGLDANVSGAFDGSTVSATLDGGVEGFGSGIAQLDGVLGESFTVSGGGERDADGSFAFDDLRVTAAALRISADGRADETSADVDAEIDLTDLARLDPRVTGAASVSAKLTGSLEDLGVKATLTIDEATAMERPIEELKLRVTATDVTGNPAGELKLSGRVDGRDATGSGSVGMRKNGGFDVTGLEVLIGSVRVAGDVSLNKKNLAEGQIVFKAADLGDLSTITLSEMTGKVDATVDLSVEDDVQVVRAKATASGVSAFDTRIGSADLDATVRDPAGRLMVDADLKARQVDAGGQRLDTIDLTATGGPEENDFTLQVAGLGASLRASGGVALDNGETTVNLASLTVSGGGQTGTLARPATIKVGVGGVAIRDFGLTTGGGGIDINGTVGDTLDMKVAINALPLSLADIAAPGTGIAGTLSGSMDVAGQAAAPTGQYNLQVRGLSVAATRQSGIASADISASGRLADGRTTIDARISGDQNLALTVSGSAPLSAAGALDIGLNGRINLAILNDFLASSGDRVTGPVDIDMRVRGNASNPDASGTIRLAGGSYTSPLNGVSFNDIALEARGGLNQIEITRLSARAPNGGTVSGSGTIRLDAGAGMPVDVRLNADNAQVISNDLVEASVDAALRLTGPAATGPDLAGTITVRRMDIQLPSRLPASVTPIAVEHVNTPPAIKAQLAEERDGGAQSGGGDYVLGLDMKVTTTNRIFVRGLGVDAQLGGEVTVRGTSAKPIILGGFQMVRGFIDFAARHIDFERGIVTFPGGSKIDPEIDFRAASSNSSITAYVDVTGPASKPTISLSSSPELPSDEVLSHLLFNKSTTNLSPGEALQLAQTAALLLGIGGGPGMVDNIRRKLGLDVLQLTSTSDGDPAVGVGRYINDNIYLGIKQGAKADSSRVTVDIDITDNITARGEVGADGSSSVGINMEWEY